MAQTSVVARLLGVRLLSLEGTVLISPLPVGVGVATSAVADRTPVRRSAASTDLDPGQGVAVGSQLSRAALLLAESVDLLDEDGSAPG